MAVVVVLCISRHTPAMSFVLFVLGYGLFMGFVVLRTWRFYGDSQKAAGLTAAREQRRLRG